MVTQDGKARGPKEQKQRAYYESLAGVLPRDFLARRGIPAIIDGTDVVLRPVHGLGAFLKAWREGAGEEAGQFLLDEMRDVIEKYDEHVAHCKAVLTFMKQHGRAPEKDEAWDLDIPLEHIDVVTDIINVQVGPGVIGVITPAEIDHFDTLSRKLVAVKGDATKLSLERLVVSEGFNVIEAKVLPAFLNDVMQLDDVSVHLERWFGTDVVPVDAKDAYVKHATELIKHGVLEGTEITLIDVATRLGVGIVHAARVIYLVSHPELVTDAGIPSDDEVDRLSQALTSALKHCQASGTDLDAALLVRRFDLDFASACNAVALYGSNFTLPDKLTRNELVRLDERSSLVIKHVKEVKPDPSVDDLMIALNLNIRDASIAFAFINKIINAPLDEDFTSYPPRALAEVDDLATRIMQLPAATREKADLIDLAHRFDKGIYAVKRALAYVSWIEKTIDGHHVQAMPPDARHAAEQKLRGALAFLGQEGLDLGIHSLINDAGLSIKDAYLIINLYNDAVSQDVDLEMLTPEEKPRIENLARKIYNLKKEGQLASYEPEHVFACDLGSVPLADAWTAITYLKLKVLNILMGESKTLRTDLGGFSTGGNVHLGEGHGVKVGRTEGIALAKGSIEVGSTEVAFKSPGARVEVKRGIDFVGGFIRYKVVIQNNSGMLINNVDVQLKMMADHIRTIDVKPKVYKRGTQATIHSMAPGQSESVDFYLEPMICGSIPVTPVVNYFDAFGKPQMASKESVTVVSKCPLIINPGEENIAKVKNLFASNEMVRSFRTFELREQPARIFDVLLQVTGDWARRPVSPPVVTSHDPYSAEAFYYVLNQNVDPQLGHQERIVINLQVNEERNVAMIHLAAEKPETVNGVLTYLWQRAGERFGETYGYSFTSLHCPECGASLDAITKGAGIVRCKYCGETFDKRGLM